MAYTIEITYKDPIYNHYEIILVTDYTFDANDSIEAKTKAFTSKNIYKYCEPYFDKTRNQIIFRILKNPYFKRIRVKKYQFYDASKPYKQEILNDGKIIQVRNPEHYIELTPDVFKNNYKQAIEAAFGSNQTIVDTPKITITKKNQIRNIPKYPPVTITKKDEQVLFKNVTTKVINTDDSIQLFQTKQNHVHLEEKAKRNDDNLFIYVKQQNWSTVQKWQWFGTYIGIALIVILSFIGLVEWLDATLK